MGTTNSIIFKGQCIDILKDSKIYFCDNIYEISNSEDEFNNFVKSSCSKCSKCLFNIKVNQYRTMAFWEAKCLVEGKNLIEHYTNEFEQIVKKEPLALPILLCSQFVERTN